MTRLPIACASLLLLAGGPALAQQAGEQSFLQRFDGNFAGSGTVRTAADSPDRSVKCTVKGSSTATRINMTGSCRAAVIFSREIGADLTFDPASGRYTGTYTGSKIGPARLSGKRSGDTVNLAVTWPKPVNGDTKAQMIITNRGDGRFTFVVADEAAPGGDTIRTTNLTLTK